MTLRLLTIILLTMTAAPSVRAQDAMSSTAAENVAIGTLIGSEGSVTLLTPGSAEQSAPPTLSARSPIHLHDVIETGPNARALIVLIDNSEITLGENTQFTIDDYIFDESNDAVNKARYSVVRGAFLYASGLIAKKTDPRYTPDVIVNTPAASIGIRGTTFWGGEIDGAYGVLVTEGKVDVQTNRGRVNIDKDLGTTITSKNDTPARGTAWEPEKIERAMATITMKNNEALRARITENAATQAAQRATYKHYLSKRFEQQKLLKDTRTPSTRIDNRLPLSRPDSDKKSETAPLEKPAPAQAPVKAQAKAQAPAPADTPAPSPVLEQQLQKLNAEIKNQGTENIKTDTPPSGKPQVDLPVINQEPLTQAPPPAASPAPSPVPPTKRSQSKADSAL